MEYMITKFLLGFALGFIGLLLPNLRTIRMLEGRYISVFFIHILASLMLIIFTIQVSKLIISFMIGNTIGGGLAVSYLSYKKRYKK